MSQLSPTTDLANTSTRTVCLVDDEPAVLRVTRQIVEDGGHTCRCFPSGEQYLSGYLPTDDCVVSDLKMPDMAGDELLRRIRQMDATLPVVILTGHADVPKTVELMQLGAVTIVEKPFTATQLLTPIDQAVCQGDAARSMRCEGQAARSNLVSLSPEEIEVLKAVVHGLPNKAISAQLGLSPRTLDRRRQKVLQVMGVGSAPELAALVERHGLLC